MHPGLAMHVVCSAELADGQRGMGPEGKRLHIPACGRRIERRCVEVIRKCLLLACVNMRKRSVETMVRCHSVHTCHSVHAGSGCATH